MNKPIIKPSLLHKDFIEFSVDIGFDKFDSLKEFFGTDPDTGNLNGCSYDYKTGIATFSVKLLPFIYDYFMDNFIETDCLNEIAKFISLKSCIDTSSKTI